MSNFLFDNCVTSKAGLEEIIQQVREYRMKMECRGVKYNELFRGQGRDCWKLIPKIARQIKQVELIEVTERSIVGDFYDYLSKEELLDAITEGLTKENLKKTGF